MKEAEILGYILSRKKKLEDKKRSLTSSRYSSAIKPHIRELEKIIRDLENGTLCEHEMKAVRDSKYPYKPFRCIKCGYEP